MAELKSLAGRIVAVTGASKGMGLRFARAFANEGAKIVLLARPSAALDEAAAEFPDALALSCDVSAPDQVRSAFAAIAARHGKLDVLVNNAAVCLPHKAEQATDDEIATQIQTNLAGPLYCIREAVPLLRAAGGGDIVNVTSESVRIPFPYLALYAATKAGLEVFSQGLRNELRPDGIRVSVLRSGHVASGGNLGASWAPERAMEFGAALVGSGLAPQGAGVEPETTADMLVHLLRLPAEANIDLMELRAF